MTTLKLNCFKEKTMINLEYLAKPVDQVHGDEHLHECFGDCDIWCTCMEEREQEKERLAEMHYYVDV